MFMGSVADDNVATEFVQVDFNDAFRQFFFAGQIFFGIFDRHHLVKIRGVLQQFGTPAEVYDDPVNEFVASFIGEPPMNILETTIVGDGDHFLFTFEGSDLQIKVPERYNNVVSNGFRCKMGVRPMDVLIGGPDSHGTPEKVATFENLGDERRIGVRVGETLLMLITDDETRYKAGDVIKLEVRGEKTHLFDIETGNRIRE